MEQVSPSHNPTIHRPLSYSAVLPAHRHILEKGRNGVAKPCGKDSQHGALHNLLDSTLIPNHLPCWLGLMWVELQHYVDGIILAIPKVWRFLCLWSLCPCLKDHVQIRGKNKDTSNITNPIFISSDPTPTHWSF